MTHHHARLVAVAIAAVSFSTPITAQQEPTPPPTLEALVETLAGLTVDPDRGEPVDTFVGHENEQGEVVEVYLFGPTVTDASLAHLSGLLALERLTLVATQVTDAGMAQLAELTALEVLSLDGVPVTDAGLAHLAGLTAL